MITILKGKEITVEWKVVSLDTKQPVDFEGVNAKVFLLAPDNIYTLPFDVVRDDFRGLRMTIPTGYISTGVYDLKVIWLKDALKDKPVYRNVSVKREAFALTDEASEVTYEGDTIKIATGVESCGRDGLSAYELAVFRGFAEGVSETEWVESLDNVLASEASRVKAEEDRVKAEDERADAEAIRIRIFTNGEQDRRQLFEISQSSRTDSFNYSEAQRQSIFESKEAQRDNNENSRMVKEEQRKIAETSRKSSEQGRETAESGRVSAESTRVSDENIRKANEQDRVDAEKNRVNAETSRANAEVARVNTENTRESNEQARVSAENGRVYAEAAREEAEGVREATFQANEAIREANETSRQDAEVVREENERKRQEAETIREATYKNKVDRNDNAPELTAGFANNLVGRGEATPQEISFRPSGGDTSIEDGTARIDRVKGSTVVWNQCDRTSDGTLTKNGITFNWSNGVLIVNGTATADFSMYGSLNGYNTVPEGRKACSIIETGSGFSGSSESWATHALFYLRLHEGAQNVSIIANSKKDYTYFLLKIKQGDVFDNVKIKSQLYDLTKMFGEGNEPTTIEEFNARKPIGIDEYAYNEGELISNNVDEIKSVGFNVFNKNGNVEQGSINTSTGKDMSSSSSKRYRTIDYIPALGETTYEIIKVNFVYQYDKNKEYIGFLHISDDGLATKKLQTDSRCRYIRVVYDINFENDICIHLAHTGYRNGDYEPYKEFRRDLPIKDIKDKDGNQLFPNGLLSAGSVYDEITATKAIKRIGVVDLGTLNWRANSDGPRFYAVIEPMKSNESWNNIGVIHSSKYILGGTGKIEHEGNIGVYNRNVYIQDNTYTDVATFKASMSGVMLYYELEEPIEVDLPEPLNLDYEVSDFGTEEVISDVPTTPMKADIIYQFNAVDRIRDNSRHTAEAEIKLKDYETRIAALEAIVASLTSSES